MKVRMLRLGIIGALAAIVGCAHSAPAAETPAPGPPTRAVVANVPTPAPMATEAGPVRPDRLAAFVRLEQTRIRDCYEKELQKDHALKGKVVMLFTITPAGRASEISVEENTFATPRIPSCIQAVIEGWSFPFRPDEDTPVAFPFVFSSVE